MRTEEARPRRDHGIFCRYVIFSCFLVTYTVNLFLLIIAPFPTQINGVREFWFPPSGSPSFGASYSSRYGDFSSPFFGTNFLCTSPIKFSLLSFISFVLVLQCHGKHSASLSFLRLLLYVLYYPISLQLFHLQFAQNSIRSFLCSKPFSFILILFRLERAERRNREGEGGYFHPFLFFANDDITEKIASDWSRGNHSPQISTAREAEEKKKKKEKR